MESHTGAPRGTLRGGGVLEHFLIQWWGCTVVGVYLGVPRTGPLGSEGGGERAPELHRQGLFPHLGIIGGCLLLPEIVIRTK